ncbi:hypothetical protein GQ53DRAFT_878085 [Thozetella sp. PMI_491]|nr:hypothetical protein GQ53DRAFT_878085 [Thozetella sp. PMI_491]
MTISELSQSHEQPLEGLETEQGRFRVWARNIGALRDPRSSSSLDSRLHDAPKARNAIVSILEALLESLNRVRGILTGDLPNRTTAIAATDDGVPQGIKIELDELMLGVRSSITDLFRYSMFLRRQQPRGREAPSSGELPAPDAFLDVRHTTDKFQKLKDRPWLAERIGYAITQRREYIRFRQRHQPGAAGTSHVTEAQQSETASTKATTYKEAGDGDAVLAEGSLDASDRSTRTNATSFMTVFHDDGTAEMAVPDLECLTFKNIRLKYNEFIECPFCRTIQKLHDVLEWRHVSTIIRLTSRHVFTDLQPYICTFEDCSSDLFKTRHEWFRHEMGCHRREWHCLKCRMVFGSQSNLRHHFKNAHPVDIAESQVEPLLNVCGRPIRRFGHGSCPLCDSWEPGLSTGDNSQDFCKHLAQHLQQLALSAIPQAIDDLEIEEDNGKEDGRVVVAEMEKVLGKEHPDTPDSVNSLVLELISQGGFEEVERLYRQTLERGQQVLDKTHPDTLRSMHNLASALHNQGKYEKAETLHRHTLARRTQILGTPHPDTLTSMHNLANTLQTQGKFEESEPLYRRTLELRELALGVAHPDTLASRDDLANMLQRQGRYKEVKPLYRARSN